MKRNEGDSEPFTMRLRAFAKLPVAEAFEDTMCLYPDNVRVLRVASATDRRHFSRYLAKSLTSRGSIRSFGNVICARDAEMR